jgi:hypothetical protein
MASWRVAKSLNVLLDQINAIAPKRDTSSDGSIGDSAHASRPSDHNPNDDGVVQARDFTHDPPHGFNSWEFADKLRQAKDPRIKYVISNGRIFSSVTSPWVWRPYHGSNAHAHHVHVSVRDDPALYDNVRPWNIGATPPDNPLPGVLFSVEGRMSTFGGPHDTGVAPQEGLALFSSEADMRTHGLGDYLLPGSLGLARRLDPTKYYVASRWPLPLYGKLRDTPVTVSANGKSFKARAVDWGPAKWTGRVCDLSPGLAKALGLDTDDECKVELIT